MNESAKDDDNCDQQKTTEERSERKIDRSHVCQPDVSCFPDWYVLADDYPGKDWQDPCQPPPIVGRAIPDQQTGGMAWWCRM